MVRHHVPKGARVLVVAAAVLHAHGLRDRDLHVVDVAPVPDGLEDPVREAEDQQVLDGLLPEVMVDPIDCSSVRTLRRRAFSSRAES